MARLVLLGALALTVGTAGAQTTSTATATVDRDGWWNYANGGVQEEAPDPPSLPVPVPIPPTPPPRNTVPEGAIATGFAVNRVDKVAAVGIVLDAEPGATVETFVLTLKEVDSRSANINAASAAIVACPITSFWAGGVPNAEWGTRPEADCDLAQAPGVRGDDGTWTFDLAAIGALWLDPFGTVAADGVLLTPDPAAEAPTTFQVSWVDVAHGGVGLSFSASGGSTGEEDPFALGGSEPATGGFDTGGATIDAGPALTPPATTPATTAAPRRAREEAAPAAFTPNRDVLGNLPWGYLLLALLVVGGSAVTTYVLGPAGQPRPHLREGGVSRALAAQERAVIPPPRSALEAR